LLIVSGCSIQAPDGGWRSALIDISVLRHISRQSAPAARAQGGDPTGTGTGGESIYGAPFRDELDQRLTHAGRGVLSMANSGPHSNGSQFFILFKSARHLDFKHTVFGRVVGGAPRAAAACERACTLDVTRNLKRTTCTTLHRPIYEEVGIARCRNAACEAASCAILRLPTFASPTRLRCLHQQKLCQTRVAKAEAHVATRRPCAAQGWRR